MITVDDNSILALWTIWWEWKQFTRNLLGYPFVSSDHTVLVYHKWEIHEKQWKDIWSGQYVIISRTLQLPPEYSLWVARIWYDIHCTLDESTQSLINTATVDNTIRAFVDNTFGVSKNALFMSSYDSLLNGDTLYSFLLWIALAHGKWQIKDGILYPVKITIPLTSSLLGMKDFFVQVGSCLKNNYIAHSMQFTNNGTYDIVHITLHDGVLLQQYAQWLNPVVKIDQISTLINTQKVFDILVIFAKERHLTLPIASIAEISIREVS